MSEQYALEIQNLTKIYGSNKVLKEISFNVKKGEILGFLGLNGAGKSTTMNIITGCISPTAGSVKVCGYDVLTQPKLAKAKIGYLPENPPLYFDMTVREYLEFVYDLKRCKLPKKDHIDDIMERVKITHMASRLIKNLSKGYKQRVGLAQAMISEPEILILDEPTVGLDPKQIIEIRNLIRSFAQKHTVILSTHILQEVSAVCDRVAIISAGNIVAQNTIKGLEEESYDKDEFTLSIKTKDKEVEKVILSLQQIKQITAVPPRESDCLQYIVKQKKDCDCRSELGRLLNEKGYSIAELKCSAPTLEEIFIHYASMNDVSSEEIEEDTPNYENNEKKED